MKHKKTVNPLKNPKNKEDETIRLNKYISNAGICSRRQADVLIAEGKVKVNGTIVTELGHKISPRDKVTVSNKILERKKHIYILLNKPKGFITTTDDEKGRATVMDLIKSATTERVFPVGRLDRNTTGLLLLTNDGELTQAMIHPSRNVEKVYSVKLNKPLTKNDFNKILSGIKLEEEEIITVDNLSYINSDDLSEIGIQIHSGQNRIIRRIFESLGYDVEKLDRVMLGILTKRDLPRGKWRFLSEKEVRILKSSLGIK